MVERCSDLRRFIFVLLYYSQMKRKSEKDLINMLLFFKIQFETTFSNVLSDMWVQLRCNKLLHSFFGNVHAKYLQVNKFVFFSRVCVELPLPSNVYFKMEAILHDRSKYERQVLHVQSISFWAPANIGPYSQAVKVSFNICSDAKPSGTSDAFLVIALILYLLKSSENLRGFKIRRSARNGLRIKVRNKSTTVSDYMPLVSFLTPWKY